MCSMYVNSKTVPLSGGKCARANAAPCMEIRVMLMTSDNMVSKFDKFVWLEITHITSKGHFEKHQKENK